MGQLDEDYLYGGQPTFDEILVNTDNPYYSVGGVSHDTQYAPPKETKTSLLSVLDEPIGQITSRDQIIDPYSIVRVEDYPNTSEGQAKYKQDLQRAIRYAELQEAAYIEWYNSESQQVARQRQAGLNPDLLGVEGSQGSDTNPLQGTPYDGIPTRGQQFANVASGIGSLVSSVASVASLGNLFSSIGLTKAQTGLVKSQESASKLGLLSAFEQLASGEISSRLSDAVSGLAAGESLDIAEWFSNDVNFEGIFEAYSPEDTPVYRQAFNNLRSRRQRSLGAAYEQGKLTAQYQTDFASLVADPNYSADMLIQIAQLKPFMNAQFELRKARVAYETKLNQWNLEYQDALSVADAVHAANATNQYNAAYFTELDGKKKALEDNFRAESEAIRLRMRKSIDNNLLEIYKQHPHDMKGIAAAYTFGDGVGMKWYEFMTSSAIAYGFEDIDTEFPIFDENGVPVTITPDGKLLRMGASSDTDDSIGLGSFK